MTIEQGESSVEGTNDASIEGANDANKLCIFTIRIALTWC